MNAVDASKLSGLSPRALRANTKDELIQLIGRLHGDLVDVGKKLTEARSAVAVTKSLEVDNQDLQNQLRELREAIYDDLETEADLREMKNRRAAARGQLLSAANDSRLGGYVSTTDFADKPT